MPLAARPGQVTRSHGGIETGRRAGIPPCDLLARPGPRHPLSDVATASPEESVPDLLPRLNGCADRRALVLSDGRPVGIVSPSDIARLLERLGRGQS